MSDRGLTPVVGFTILVGITAVGAMSLFVVGMSLADATQSSAEQEQLDQSMAQFADTANAIASSNSDSDEFQLSGTDDGSGEVISDAGHIEMWVENDTSEQTLLDSQLGAYRYQTADGYEVAYQGGGVWRTSGNGSAQVVQSPPFDYRNGDDPTLTYEFVRMLGSNSETGDVTGSLNRVNNSNVYPGPDDPNPLQNGSVHLQVESDYCEGWEQFLNQRTDGAVIESCDETAQTNEGELRAKFIVPFEFEGLENELIVTRNNDDHNSGGAIYDRHFNQYEHDFRSPDTVIQSKLDDCASGDGTSLSRTVNEGGLYCSNEMTSGTYTFNTGGDDIKVAVDGPVTPNEIEINGDGNVTFFADGDYAMSPGGNADWGGDGASASQLRLIVHSEQQFAAQGGSTGGGNFNMRGFIYGPESDMHFGKNLNVWGGIVADTIVEHTGAASYNDDDTSVKGMELNFESGGEPFYYLHVSQTTLSVNED